MYLLIHQLVATVLTVYGIETIIPQSLQVTRLVALQQYLPFTVLKLEAPCLQLLLYHLVATVLTVYGIETLTFVISLSFINSCNSTYRLRY